jgi:hypothetical protein
VFDLVRHQSSRTIMSKNYISTHLHSFPDVSCLMMYYSGWMYSHPSTSSEIVTLGRTRVRRNMRNKPRFYILCAADALCSLQQGESAGVSPAQKSEAALSSTCGKILLFTRLHVQEETPSARLSLILFQKFPFRPNIHESTYTRSLLSYRNPRVPSCADGAVPPQPIDNNNFLF